MDRKITNTQDSTPICQTESNNDPGLEIISFNESENPDSINENENEEVVLEPLEQSLYEVSYTCLLLPRLVSHQLIGDVAEQLQSILKQVSISYGWHLEFTSVKPEYFQWMIRVPPSTSTTFVMQVVRTQTTHQIFEKFPRFKRENQSGDFWAPGYLIFWGAQPHPMEVIRRYIHQTRKQQGILVDE